MFAAILILITAITIPEREAASGKSTVFKLPMHPLERIAIECRKTIPKVITLVSHN